MVVASRAVIGFASGKLKLFPGTAGVPPARVRYAQASGVESMLRGRADARGPRKSLSFTSQIYASIGLKING